jgi:hypothetical protein
VIRTPTYDQRRHQQDVEKTPPQDILPPKITWWKKLNPSKVYSQYTHKNPL